MSARKDYLPPTEERSAIEQRAAQMDASEGCLCWALILGGISFVAAVVTALILFFSVTEQ